ncbi:hypothetical protein RQN9TF_12535 [Rhodococcus qingshengii]|uniref:hypothetical protein n=1 Tax=Rhodococcus TaxID=1827 RepID=UPI000F61A024|nr:MULTISPECIES: hypothetical protein [Rhodococcus]AZI61820.1 hypothetical protein EHW12_12075 [Rhodococcus sp. NJ-530]BDQ20031.1 hypothetical protein RQN9TF_12535 [Rhodococcus qingshengii]
MPASGSTKINREIFDSIVARSKKSTPDEIAMQTGYKVSAVKFIRQAKTWEEFQRRRNAQAQRVSAKRAMNPAQRPVVKIQDNRITQSKTAAKIEEKTAADVTKPTRRLAKGGLVKSGVTIVGEKDRGTHYASPARVHDGQPVQQDGISAQLLLDAYNDSQTAMDKLNRRMQVLEDIVAPLPKAVRALQTADVQGTVAKAQTRRRLIEKLKQWKRG